VGYRGIVHSPSDDEGAEQFVSIVSSAPASTWFQVLSASDTRLIRDAQTGQLHIISPHLQVIKTPPEHVSDASLVQVISWDPSRPWRGSPASSARESPVLARSAVGPASSVTWGEGLWQSASLSVGGQTSGPTLTAHQVFCHQAPIGPERFHLPPTPVADANIGAISG